MGLVRAAPPVLLALPGFVELFRRDRAATLLVGGACAAQLADLREVRAVERLQLRAALLAVGRRAERAARGSGAGVRRQTRAGVSAPDRCRRLRAKLAGLLQRHRWVPLAAAFAIIEIAYVFFVSAGRFTHWPTTLSFLDDQAEGFRAGHLHFAIEPAARAAGQGQPVRSRRGGRSGTGTRACTTAITTSTGGPCPRCCWPASRRCSAFTRTSATRTSSSCWRACRRWRGSC